jgi:hypothetical protein
MAVAPGCATDTDEPEKPGPMTPVRPPDQPTPVQPLRHEGVGGALVELVDTFNDPTDPVKKLLETIADAVGSEDGSKLRQFFSRIELAAVAGLQTKFPEQWRKVTNFGTSVVSMVRRFGVRARLELPAGSTTGEVKGRLTVFALTFRIQTMTGEELRELKLADAGLQEIVVDNLSVNVSADGAITIAEHTFGVTFGNLADMAIQQIIIPTLDPTLATEAGDRLAPFLKKLVKCTAADGRTLGALVVEELGEEFDWAGGLIDTACTTGVNYVVTYLNQKLDQNTEGALSFKVSGSGRLVDNNNDRIADAINLGSWTGEVTIAGTVAPLAGDQQFLGAR